MFARSNKALEPLLPAKERSDSQMNDFRSTTINLNSKSFETNQLPNGINQWFNTT